MQGFRLTERRSAEKTKKAPPSPHPQDESEAGASLFSPLLSGGLIPFVFFPGGDAAADMSLGFIFIQNTFHLFKKGLIKRGKSLG